MNWNAFLNEIKRPNANTTLHLREAADSDLFNKLQKEFKLKELPLELINLYVYSNGIEERMKGEHIGNLIWPIEQVIETNKQYRKSKDFKELYMSFDQLLFFAEAGNGDLFGTIVLNGRFDRNDVFVWNHEDDSRMWIAPNMLTFIDRWANGSITV